MGFHRSRSDTCACCAPGLDRFRLRCLQSGRGESGPVTERRSCSAAFRRAIDDGRRRRWRSGKLRLDRHRRQSCVRASTHGSARACDTHHRRLPETDSRPFVICRETGAHPASSAGQAFFRIMLYFAATTMISTLYCGAASFASTVARAGVLPDDTQASHTAFISGKVFMSVM